MRGVRAQNRWLTVLQEGGFVVAIFLFYQAGNALWEVDVPPVPQTADASAAHANLFKLWAWEKEMGIAWEPSIQAFFQPHTWAMWILVFFYAGPHFALSLAFLGWVYWYRFEAFAYVRNAAILFTTTAFAFQWAFPVAPPRLLVEFQMEDTLQAFLPIHSQTPWVTSLVNDYAGFPSVHTGWSLLVALLCIRLARSPWRWLWLLYPSMIAVSIAATANHVLWDVVGALAWVGGCELLHHALAVGGRFPFLSTIPTPIPPTFSVPVQESQRE